jgi:site-specific recombinase XerD
MDSQTAILEGSAHSETAVTNAGLDALPHVMRHTVETRLAEQGADIKTRMELLRHKTHIMALRYDSATGQWVKNAADLLVQSLTPSLEIAKS